jgi:hypothetical protein
MLDDPATLDAERELLLSVATERAPEHARRRALAAVTVVASGASTISLPRTGKASLARSIGVSGAKWSVVGVVAGLTAAAAWRGLDHGTPKSGATTARPPSARAESAPEKPPPRSATPVPAPNGPANTGAPFVAAPSATTTRAAPANRNTSASAIDTRQAAGPEFDDRSAAPSAAFTDEHGAQHAAQSDDAAPSSAPSVSAVPRAPSLSDEIGMLEAARSQLAGAQPAKALAILDSHDAAFPRSSFFAEARVLRVRTHERLGRHSEAKDIARRFVAEYPRSTYTARMRAIAGEPVD